MKILVVIANYGTKNQKYLDRLLSEYRSMSFDIHIVILSNIPKEFDENVEVRVGLPEKNPWSLPFFHKQLFVERRDDYDLFIYSEDDTLITERNISGFLWANSLLAEDDIAGFLRFEEDDSGQRYCSSMHGPHYWDISSIKEINGHIFAHYSNEHSACFILTKEQLHKAIASGGFDVPPHEGRYDMLCSAATDPYMQCGLNKMICISRIDDFLLHHLPNQYLGKMGLAFDDMYAQLDVLKTLAGLEAKPAALFTTSKKLSSARWDKSYHEKRQFELLPLLPHSVRHVLSIGCGDGSYEIELANSGSAVTAIPLDPVIAASAKKKGFKVVESDFMAAYHQLQGQRFDALMLMNVLQHIREPSEIVDRFSQLVHSKGAAMVLIPNFNFVRYWFDIDVRRARRLDGFYRTCLKIVTRRQVKKLLMQNGFVRYKVDCVMPAKLKGIEKMGLNVFRSIFAQQWLIVGYRPE